MAMTNDPAYKLANAQHPDIIVIGAGVTGCCLAWHLHQSGLKVQVLEAQRQPATQTTGAAAGFVAHWSYINNPTWHQNEWAMQRYGIEFYRQLAERTDGDIGFYPCGIAYVALTESGWADMQPRIAAARNLGTHLEILNAERAGQLMPFISFDATRGIAFDPDSVRIRAAAAIPALAAELASEGVDFRFGVKITGFVRSNGRIAGVTSTQGKFRSPLVAIAAGAWSRPLLSQLGVACPTEPVVQSRFVTPPLPGIDSTMPMLIFADCHGFYIREEQGGLLIGGSDNNPMPADRIVDAMNPPATQEIATRQAYRMREYLSKIQHAMPILQQSEVAQIATGLPAMTADRYFVTDAVPGHPGLFAIAACQYAGVTHGPALGRLMTELIVDGSSSWDRSAYRLTRFAG
jgi:sarcosine oxidase, subunit beta